MKEHILCQYGETVKKVENTGVIYDFLTQISYRDLQRTQRVIDTLRSPAQNATPLSSTVLTENVEHSDADHLLLWESTVETRGAENSDLDNVWRMASTTTTFATECTDKDC